MSCAERALVKCVGRGGEIQKQATSLPDNFRDGVAIVEAVGQKRSSFQQSSQMVMPSCSALNGKTELAEWRVGSSAIRRRHRRWEEAFCAARREFCRWRLGRRNWRRVCRCLSMASPTKPTSDGSGMDLARRDEFLLVAFDEGGAFDEILRGVAADAEFGEDG